MGKDKLLIFLLSAILLAGCVKDIQDIPESLTHNPVFKMQVSIDQQILNIEAGTNGWIMQPSVYQADSNVVYSSLFAQEGCPDDCGPSFEFNFYRTMLFTENSAEDFENTIRNGNKDYVLSDAERLSYDIFLSTHPALFMSGYSQWNDLNLPGTSNELVYQCNIGYGQDLHVCFESVAISGCQYSQCIRFDPATITPCLSYIIPKIISPNFISLTAVPQGTPPFKFQWYGDSIDLNSTVILPLQDSMTEVFANVVVTDARGNRSALKQVIRISNGNSDPCYFPIHLESIPFTRMNAVDFADKVEISYRDEDGVEWRSIAGVQTPQSQFLIHQLSYFDDTHDGIPAYKTEVSFNADMYNTLTGEVRRLSTENAVIAVGYRP